MLARDGLEKQGEVLELMSSSVKRMSGLIDDVMDFARGQLGGGIGIYLKATDTLNATLRQIVAEQQSSNPDRAIITDIELLGTVTCDASRIGQMASNLLGNAVSHGSKDAPVRLGASQKDGLVELFVTNSGDAIPAEKLARLFQPFFRGEASGIREGLGLGLHIASEIAKVHGATLSVSSDPEETRSNFSMRADR